MLGIHGEEGGGLGVISIPIHSKSMVVVAVAAVVVVVVAAAAVASPIEGSPQ